MELYYKFTMKVHFPNLNAIRFFAAFMVIIHHIEQNKGLFGMANIFNQGNIQLMGKIGVTLFFVLSGFLITYLLLVEEKEAKKIDIKAFYMRRILRIWPLYYLIIALAFFVFPFIDFMYLPGHDTSNWAIKLAFFVFFMPNVIHALGAGLAFGTQAWSVGAEEQFYLVWPWLMNFFKNKLALILSVLAAYLAIRLTFTYLFEVHVLFAYLSKIWSLIPIDNMAIGGLFAVIYYNKYPKLIAMITHPILQVIVWISVIYLLFTGISLGFFHHQIYAMLFGILIFNLATNPKTVVKFKSKILDYLGKISFGLYMYHSIFIVISIKVLQALNFSNNLLVYILSFMLTIVVASLSYEYFEKRFLNMKIKYSKVLSRD